MDINILKDNDIDVDASIEILGDLEMYNETLKDFRVFYVFLFFIHFILIKMLHIVVLILYYF